MSALSPPSKGREKKKMKNDDMLLEGFFALVVSF
jgi:hypothetical protein